MAQATTVLLDTGGCSILALTEYLGAMPPAQPWTCGLAVIVVGVGIQPASCTSSASGSRAALAASRTASP
jgi:hypothetical protein